MMLAIVIVLINLPVNLCQLSYNDTGVRSSDVSNTSSNLSCPAWYNPTKGGCVCGNALDSTVQCYGKNRVKVRFTFCMSYDSKLTLVGNCPYSNKRISTENYVQQPRNQSHLNEHLCGWINRTGFLCNRCKPGLGVAAMTYMTCVRCLGKWQGWMVYLALSLGPSTILFLLLIFGHISNSEKVRSLVCIIQVLMFYVDRYPHVVRENFHGKTANYLFVILVTIGGVCNLDFFRYSIPAFCISRSFNTLDIIALEYMVALYPMVLTCLAYVVIQLYARDFKVLQFFWLPLKWCLSKLPWCMNHYSLVKTFATCLELSYSKLIFVSFNLLAYTKLLKSDGDSLYKYVSYYNSDYVYFSGKHIPYILLSITMLSIFVILPMVLLFVYQAKPFQKLLGYFPKVNWLPLHSFADAFNGCYKNGTNGCRDYRFIGGYFLFIRLLFYSASIMSSFKGDIICGVSPMLSVLVFGILRPYKNDFYNKLDILHWCFLQFFVIVVTFNMYAFDIPLTMKVLIGLTILLYILGFVSLKILTTCFPRLPEKLKSVWMKILHKLCPLRSISLVHDHTHGHSQIGSNEDISNQLENYPLINDDTSDISPFETNRNLSNCYETFSHTR